MNKYYRVFAWMRRAAGVVSIVRTVWWIVLWIAGEEWPLPPIE